MFDKKALRRIKLVVSDLDGSILNSNAEISSYTRTLIAKLSAKGVKFTFASGRVSSALYKYVNELDIALPVIALDGCCICYPSTGVVISETYIPAKFVRRALIFADKYLLNVVLCRNEAIYYTESNSVIKDIMDKFGTRYEEVNSYDRLESKTLEVVFASDYKENILHAKDKFSFPYVLGLNVSYYKSQKNDGIYYLELRRKGVNKGTALKKLLRKLSIKQSRVAVIGDWYNDISLFETGALKITLENGVPELKKKADIIIPKTNDQEGVAEFLEMLLKVN